jgi:hypothetical protein
MVLLVGQCACRRNHCLIALDRYQTDEKTTSRYPEDDVVTLLLLSERMKLRWSDDAKMT